MNREKIKPGIFYHILSVAILTFLLRMALPEARYVFYPLFLILTGYFLLNRRGQSGFRPIFRSLLFYLILLAILMAAALYDSPFIRPWTEFFNGLELMVLFLILLNDVRTKLAFQEFKRIFAFQLFVFSVVIGLVGLIRGVTAWVGGTASPAAGESIFAPGSDYNFYVLAILYGIVVGIYHIYSHFRLRGAGLFVYNGSLVVLALNILLIPSRRGIVVFGVILFFLVLVRLWVLFRRTPGLTRVSRLDPFLLVILGVILGGHLLLFETSPGFKKDMLIRSGLYRMDVRERITNLYCRYVGMVDKNLEFRKVYHRLWNPREIHSGGGHTILADSFLQDGSARFTRMRQTEVRHYNEEQEGAAEFLVIATASPEGGIEKQLYVDVGDTIEVTVWVRVLRWSPQLGIRMPGPDNRSIRKVIAAESWEGDGRWHQLRLKVGYDVFGSLPLRIGGGGPDRVSLSCWSGIQVVNGKGTHSGIQRVDSVGQSGLPELSRERIQEFMALEPQEPRGVDDRNNAGNTPENRATAVPGFIKSMLVKENKKDDEVAPPDGFVETGAADSRLARWQLAREIYGDYTPTQKIAGNGFGYLPVYGLVFYDDAHQYDYPHNPLISAFLYSGLVGGIFYLVYLLAALVLYFRYLKKEALFFVLFLLTGLFVSVSGNSHFSVPAFAFFAQWPFLIRLFYPLKEVKS
jgi:hypothetical protein